MKVYVHPKASVSATKNKYFFMPVTGLLNYEMLNFLSFLTM